MLEHGRAVIRHVLNELDGVPLGPAEQPFEPSLALDQRQVAKVVAVMLVGNIRGVPRGKPIGLRHCPLGEQYFYGASGRSRGSSTR
jgi:hypothetical protein